MANRINQAEKLKPLIIKLCNKVSSRTFSLKELHSEYDDYSQIDIGGKTPQATIRRLLQELQNEHQFLLFEKNNKGWYTLTQTDLLDCEKKDLNGLNISTYKDKPDKKEYLIETYARSPRWVKQAKEVFGCHCLLDNCQNTFKKPNGEPYIEVHHIIPLYQGGEDGIWNLSVLCAHHHRMAHFSAKKNKDNIQSTLLEAVKEKLLINPVQEIEVPPL
jgi:predicted HNH restriction endonuclease